MKKILTLLCFLLITTAAFAQFPIISGIVTHVGNNAPLSNQTVWATDSNTAQPWSLSTTTNANGYYSITIPGGTTVNSMIIVGTAACGLVTTQVFNYNNQSITANFNVCANSPAQPQLKGYINVGSSSPMGTKVYLIRKSYDSVLMSWMLTALDSTTTNGNGYYIFSPGTVPSGTLLLKAALQAGTPNYTAYLPTYYTNSLIWSGATTIPASAWTASSMTNITLVGGVNAGGPGFVGGSVLVGANKTAGIGDPLNSRILILKTAAGVAVAYTYSGADGSFSFPSIPLGSYEIHGDAAGKNNPALAFTLTAAKPSVSTVVFEENNTQFKGHLGSLATGNVAPVFSGTLVYPNPMRNTMNVESPYARHITLLNSVGAVVVDQDINVAAAISVAHLPAGLYIARILTDNGIVQVTVAK